MFLWLVAMEQGPIPPSNNLSNATSPNIEFFEHFSNGAFQIAKGCYSSMNLTFDNARQHAMALLRYVFEPSKLVEKWHRLATLPLLLIGVIEANEKDHGYSIYEFIKHYPFCARRRFSVFASLLRVNYIRHKCPKINFDKLNDRDAENRFKPNRATAHLGGLLVLHVYHLDNLRNFAKLFASFKSSTNCRIIVTTSHKNCAAVEKFCADISAELMTFENRAVIFFRISK